MISYFAYLDLFPFIRTISDEMSLCLFKITHHCSASEQEENLHVPARAPNFHKEN